MLLLLLVRFYGTRRSWPIPSQPRFPEKSVAGLFSISELQLRSPGELQHGRVAPPARPRNGVGPRSGPAPVEGGHAGCVIRWGRVQTAICRIGGESRSACRPVAIAAGRSGLALAGCVIGEPGQGPHAETSMVRGKDRQGV